MILVVIMSRKILEVPVVGNFVDVTAQVETRAEGGL